MLVTPQPIVPQQAILPGAQPMAAYGAPMQAMPQAGMYPTATMPQGYPPAMVPPGYGPQMGMPQAAHQYSQVLGQASSVLGAEAIQPPSSGPTVIKSVLVGAGAGAAMGFLVSRFIGGPIGLIAGGLVGGVIGLVRGLKKAREQQAQFQSQVQAASQQAINSSAAAQAPAAPVQKKKAKAKKKTLGLYKVKSGDTLSAIAKRHETDWKSLYAINKATVGSNPNLIHIGTTLKVPSQESILAKRRKG